MSEQSEFNKTKRSNKKIYKRIAKIDKRIDYINKLHWEKMNLISKKRELQKKIQLP